MAFPRRLGLDLNRDPQPDEFLDLNRDPFVVAEDHVHTDNLDQNRDPIAEDHLHKVPVVPVVADDVNDYATIFDTDTVDDLINKSQKLQQNGSQNSKAYATITARIHEILWTNLGAVGAYSPRLPGHGVKLIEDSLMMTKKGNVSLNHCYTVSKNMKDRVLSLGSLLSRSLVHLFLSVSKCEMVPAQFKAFTDYLEAVSRDKADMEVIHKIVITMRNATAVVQSKAKGKSPASIHAQETHVEALLHKFELVIWELQAILSYPAIPNTLVLQNLESSPTAICLDQCKDAITDLLEQVQKFTSSAPSSSQTEATVLELKATLISNITATWS